MIYTWIEIYVHVARKEEASQEGPQCTQETSNSFYAMDECHARADKGMFWKYAPSSHA